MSILQINLSDNWELFECSLKSHKEAGLHMPGSSFEICRWVQWMDFGQYRLEFHPFASENRRTHRWPRIRLCLDMSKKHNPKISGTAHDGKYTAPYWFDPQILLLYTQDFPAVIDSKIVSPTDRWSVENMPCKFQPNRRTQNYEQSVSDRNKDPKLARASSIANHWSGSYDRNGLIDKCTFFFMQGYDQRKGLFISHRKPSGQQG